MRKHPPMFSCRNGQKRIVGFVLSLVLAFFLCPACTPTNDSATAPQEVGFRGTAQVKNEGDKQYKGLRLTGEIYHAAQENLADLRLFDQDGQPVPYFIHSFSPQETAVHKSHPMELIHSFTKGDSFYYDYAVDVPEDEDVLATSLTVVTNHANFAKQVELFGSYDNRHWEKIKDALLYRVEGNEKLEIPLGPPAPKYTHYRFKIPNNLEKIAFTGVTLNYNDVTLSHERFTETFTPQYTIEEQGQKTLIKLSGLRNLKLDSFTLETDSIFKRRVIFADIHAKTLYNLSFQQTHYSDLTLPLDGFRTSEDTAVLVIENNDDQPIQVKQLQVKYYVDELVFNGAGKTGFVLKFGHPEYTVPPTYDLAFYQDQILQEGYDLLPILALKILPADQATTAEQLWGLKDPRFLFNSVIVAVAILLGVIIIRKLIK
jgi:hypothetical protein